LLNQELDAAFFTADPTDPSESTKKEKKEKTLIQIHPADLPTKNKKKKAQKECELTFVFWFCLRRLGVVIVSVAMRRRTLGGPVVSVRRGTTTSVLFAGAGITEAQVLGVDVVVIILSSRGGRGVEGGV
jgi:hypothetical protein